MEVLTINGHDYSRYIERKGVGWSRNDLDSDKTVRTKDGSMRRDKVTTKRRMSYTMMDMPRDLLAQLDDDLSEDTFPATYLDLHGTQTRTFYCSSFSADIDSVYGDNDIWTGASFDMIEV